MNYVIRNKAMKEMYDDGYPSTAVAEAFNISRERVRQLIGVCWRHTRNSPGHKDSFKYKQKPKSIYRFLKRISVDDGCWEWLAGRFPTGYGKIGISSYSQVAGPYAHRFSWLVFNGAIPPGIHVLHKCDNPGCVRPDHLFLGTHQDNIADRDRKGRGYWLKGEDHPGSKLTNNQVINILKDDTHTHRELGEHYGVAFQTITSIKTRKTWKHING